MIGKGMPILLRKLKTALGLYYDASNFGKFLFRMVAVIIVLASRKVMCPSISFEKRYQLMLQSIIFRTGVVPRKDDTKCVLILVDCWTKFVHAEPIKIRNRRSVGESMSLFIGRLGHAGTVELCVDNENVIKAGAEHCRDCRLRMGFQTILSVNKQYDKARTSTAERMIQSIRNLGKTLVAQLESEAKVRLPSGHCLRYWAVVHAGGLYSRYHVHSFLKITPFQAVTGRPYSGKLANFGQMVFGLDPKTGKYKPMWKRGVYLGKDAAGHDVIGTAPGEFPRTKALRRTSNLWSAEDALAMEIGPWDTTRYTYSQAKPTPLPPVLPQLADVDAAAVANYKGGSSEEEEDTWRKRIFQPFLNPLYNSQKSHH